MVKRIEWILSTKNLTPAQLADSIGIQRSSLSHILARRNKPSLDVVMKILHRYPDLQTDWLLTGKGPMYKESGNMGDLEQSPVASSPIETPLSTSIPAPLPPSLPASIPSTVSGLNLFSDDEQSTSIPVPSFDKRDSLPLIPPMDVEQPLSARSFSEPAEKRTVEKENPPLASRRDQTEDHQSEIKEIERIVFFYSDGSFRVYES